MGAITLLAPMERGALGQQGMQMICAQEASPWKNAKKHQKNKSMQCQWLLLP